LQEQFVLGSQKAPGGRPKGSTAKAKQSLDVKKKRAIDEVAISDSKEKVKFQGKVPDGLFQKICQKVHDDFNIHLDSLKRKKQTILSRVAWNSLHVKSRGARSPMAQVEPIIFEFALWKQEAGQPVTTGEGIALATSLIKNTELERKVQAFQTSGYGKDTWSLSTLCWKRFIRRHTGSLSLAKENRVAACQTEWTAYENVLEMYSLVYDQMVYTGVTRNLPIDEQFWTNNLGEKVQTEAEASGC
jgi:hypothetical protein